MALEAKERGSPGSPSSYPTDPVSNALSLIYLFVSLSALGIGDDSSL